jgi:hypothetical protein
VRLWRLLSQRRPTFDTSIEQMRAVVAREAGVPSGELAAVVENGAIPDPDLVRKLAPTLGIHTADLFVIAGCPYRMSWPRLGRRRRGTWVRSSGMPCG